MPVHFDYKGHVGLDPRRPGSPNVPSRINVIIRGGTAFTQDLERAVGDAYPEQFKNFKDRIAEIQKEANALVNELKEAGTQVAQRP